MEPYFDDGQVSLYLGDCLEVLPEVPDGSVDAVACDPPYGLEFMGAEWDKFRPSGARIRRRADARTNPAEGKSVTAVPESYVAGAAYQEWCQAWAAECLRVLKPGGHLLAFGGTRTYHRLACGIEDAGLEVRDSLHWLYGGGFPKSKNLDGEREGWGTALKPAHEPVVLARKPLAGTVAANAAEHGTGALNINGCRVAHASPADLAESRGKNRHADFGSGPRANEVFGDMGQHARAEEGNYDGSAGRWPPNVLLAHAAGCQPAGLAAVRSNGHHPAQRGASGYSGGWDGQQGLPERRSGMETVEAWDCAPGCPVADLDRQSGASESNARRSKGRGLGYHGADGERGTWGLDDRGGASRFFPVFRYEAKAPDSERPRLEDGTMHPTVKPVDLMRWLVRLVTPPGGLVLDPFAGSGTTGEACIVEGFPCLLVERDARYADLAVKRLSKPIQPDLFGGAAL